MKTFLYSSFILAPAALLVRGDNLDCEYSACQQRFTLTDCQEIATQCQTYGGISSCNAGEYEFECNNIALDATSSCTTDVAATSQCATYTYPTIETCVLTEGDCDAAELITRAPTPAGGNAITRIDCSYDSCSQLLTSTDCSSLTTQCSNSGGVASCIPGDNEFECHNIPYTGSSACTDATATSQCLTYDYGGGYSCLEREGDCDDPITMTFAPTPAAAVERQHIDCTYDDCTSLLTADDCAAIASTCSALGGVSFCIPGDNEFECNNIDWTDTGSGGCTDATASNQCLQYSFGFTCLDWQGGNLFVPLKAH